MDRSSGATRVGIGLIARDGRYLIRRRPPLPGSPMPGVWEFPGGKCEPGESPEQAAARETLEETGWQPGPLTLMTSYHPSNGATDQTFHLFKADGATYVGDPHDPYEAERVEWVPVEDVRQLVRKKQVQDGLSLTALLWFLAF